MAKDGKGPSKGWRQGEISKHAIRKDGTLEEIKQHSEKANTEIIESITKCLLTRSS